MIEKRMKMEKTFTVLSFFLLALITMFPLNSTSAYSQDSCCCSAVESVIVATASGCTCDDTENLAFINVTTKMMKLHSVFGVSLLSIVDAPESHGLENLIANSAAESPSQSNVHAQSPNSEESPSSESSSKEEPNSAAAPAPVEVPDDNKSDADIWAIIIIMVILVVTGACCKD